MAKFMLSVAEQNRIFKEACDGYGFVETEHATPDGFFCEGCYTVHKRPTKMYQGGPRNEKLCKHQVIRLYNPEDEQFDGN